MIPPQLSQVGIQINPLLPFDGLCRFEFLLDIGVAQPIELLLDLLILLLEFPHLALDFKDIKGRKQKPEKDTGREGDIENQVKGEAGRLMVEKTDGYLLILILNREQKHD